MTEKTYAGISSSYSTMPASFHKLSGSGVILPNDSLAIEIKTRDLNPSVEPERFNPLEVYFERKSSSGLDVFQRQKSLYLFDNGGRFLSYLNLGIELEHSQAGNLGDLASQRVSLRKRDLSPLTDNGAHIKQILEGDYALPGVFADHPIVIGLRTNTLEEHVKDFENIDLGDMPYNFIP